MLADIQLLVQQSMTKAANNSTDSTVDDDQVANWQAAVGVAHLSVVQLPADASASAERQAVGSIQAGGSLGVTVPKEDILLLMRDGCPELYTPRDDQKVPTDDPQDNTGASAAAEANEAQVADGSLSPQTRSSNRRRKSISEGLTEDQAFARFMMEIETVSGLCAD